MRRLWSMVHTDIYFRLLIVKFLVRNFSSARRLLDFSLAKNNCVQWHQLNFCDSQDFVFPIAIFTSDFLAVKHISGENFEAIMITYYRFRYTEHYIWTIAKLLLGAGSVLGGLEHKLSALIFSCSHGQNSKRKDVPCSCHRALQKETGDILVFFGAATTDCPREDSNPWPPKWGYLLRSTCSSLTASFRVDQTRWLWAQLSGGAPTKISYLEP